MLCAVGILSTVGLNLGIDFTGGSLTEVMYDTRPSEREVAAAVTPLALGDYSLRQTSDADGGTGYILRTRALEENERQALTAAVTELGEGGEVTRFTSVGPTIGAELARKAVWAVGGVAAIILIYVGLAFLGVARPVGSWVYGGITVIALLHDVLVPAAAMSLLGLFAGVEANTLFVMALLAILGYSVNDTIVVFDRVRENLARHRETTTETDIDAGGVERTVETYRLTKPFGEIVNESVNQTLLRSVNTSATTLLAVGALFFLGGETTQVFAFLLMLGVLAGTYSSLFFAPPLLVWYEARRRRERSPEQNPSV